MGIAKSLRKANYLEGLNQGISKIVNMLKEEEKKEKQRQNLQKLAELYKNYQEQQEDIINKPNFELLPGKTINWQDISTQPQRLSGSNIPAMSRYNLLSRLSPDQELQNKIQNEIDITNQLMPTIPEQKTRKVSPLEKYLEAKKVTSDFMSNLYPFILDEDIDEATLGRMNVLGKLLESRAESIKPQKKEYQQYDPEKDIAYVDDYGNLVIERPGKKDEKLFHRTENLIIDGKPKLVGINDITGEKVILGDPSSYYKTGGEGGSYKTGGEGESNKENKLLREASDELNKALNVLTSDYDPAGNEIFISDEQIRNQIEYPIKKARNMIITDPKLKVKFDVLESPEQYGRLLSPEDIQKEFGLVPPDYIKDNKGKLNWIKDNTKDLTDKQLDQLNTWLSLYNQGYYQQLREAAKRKKLPPNAPRPKDMNKLDFESAAEQKPRRFRQNSNDRL